MSQCQAPTKKGAQCSRKATNGSVYCTQHRNITQTPKPTPIVTPPIVKVVPAVPTVKVVPAASSVKPLPVTPSTKPLPVAPSVKPPVAPDTLTVGTPPSVPDTLAVACPTCQKRTLFRQVSTTSGTLVTSSLTISRSLQTSRHTCTSRKVPPMEMVGISEPTVWSTQLTQAQSVWFTSQCFPPKVSSKSRNNDSEPFTSSPDPPDR